MKKNHKTKSKKDEIDKFLYYVFKQDEISIILKSHLHLEQKIDELIKKTTTNPEIVLKGYFSNKINFLYSIGIITKKFLGRLRVINEIRNSYSHEYNYSLSVKDKDKLFKLLGKNTEIPQNLLTFPNAKESIMFATAVSFLIQHFNILVDIEELKNPKLSRKIFMDASDRVYDNRERGN